MCQSANPLGHDNVDFMIVSFYLIISTSVEKIAFISTLGYFALYNVLKVGLSVPIIGRFDKVDRFDQVHLGFGLF